MWILCDLTRSAVSQPQVKAPHTTLQWTEAAIPASRHGPYRWLRYVAAKGAPCDLAGVQFLSVGVETPEAKQAAAASSLSEATAGRGEGVQLETPKRAAARGERVAARPLGCKRARSARKSSAEVRDSEVGKMLPPPSRPPAARASGATQARKRARREVASTMSHLADSAQRTVDAHWRRGAGLSSISVA